jgi:hypothetical protein
MVMSRRAYVAGLLALVPAYGLRAAFAEDKLRIPSYKPPSRSAPGGRIGGGSRGSQDEIPTLLTLAPDHRGLATTDAPTLYWFISQPAHGADIKITLADTQGGEPLLSHALSGEIPRGIHPLALSAENVHLKPEAEYEWKISFVSSADNTKTMITRGLVSYVEPKASLQHDVAKTKREDLSFLYASQGYWYDSIQAISALIAEHPEDMNFRLMRAALLDQVRLHDAADLDRESAG